MRKRLSITALLVFTCVPVFAQSRFSLKATGGWGYIAAGDINKASRSYNEKYRTFPNYYSALYAGIHSAPLLGFEACFSVAKRTFIGLGASFYPGSFDDRLSYEQGPMNVTRWYTLHLTVFPITLSAYTALPVRPWLDMVLTAGAGYYLTTFDHAESADFSAWPAGLSSSRNEFKARRGAFGIHGGLGFEIKITPGWRFLVQAVGRLAELKDVTGEWSSLAKSPEGTSLAGGSDHVFYYVEEEIEGKVYSRLHYGKTAPSAVTLARKATIDLSGFALVGGFRFTFGKKDPDDGSLVFR
jgi:hypothetical protein